MVFDLQQIENHKVEWNVKSKVGSMDYAKHQPGGGTKKVTMVAVAWQPLYFVSVSLLYFAPCFEGEVGYRR